MNQNQNKNDAFDIAQQRASEYTKDKLKEAGNKTFSFYVYLLLAGLLTFCGFSLFTENMLASLFVTVAVLSAISAITEYTEKTTMKASHEIVDLLQALISASRSADGPSNQSPTQA